MARSRLSTGIFAPRRLSRTMRKRGFISGSAPPIFVAMAISLPSLANILPRLASIAPLKCLTFAHRLCPAICLCLFHAHRRSIAQNFSDTGSDFRGVIADADDRVSLQLRGVGQHLPKGIVAGLLAKG